MSGEQSPTNHDSELSAALCLRQRAADICHETAVGLARRYLDAARFQQKANSVQIEQALRKWAVAMNIKYRTIRRSFGAVSQFDIGALSSSLHSENRKEALTINKIKRETLRIIGVDRFNLSTAMYVSNALAARLVEHFFPEGTNHFYFLPSVAPSVIGAAQIASLRHYNVNLPLLEAFEAGCMFVWLLDQGIFWAPKPDIFHMSGRVLHNDKGPAIVWFDGIVYHYWKGTHVPAWAIITPPEKISVRQVDETWNVEVRRVLLERMGEHRYIQESGMKPIDSDPRFGTLYVKRFSNGRPLCRLRVVNATPEPDGTYRVYWLPINPDLYDGQAGWCAQAAAASTWRTTPGGSELFFANWHNYSPTIET